MRPSTSVLVCLSGGGVSSSICSPNCGSAGTNSTPSARTTSLRSSDPERRARRGHSTVTASPLAVEAVGHVRMASVITSIAQMTVRSPHRIPSPSPRRGAHRSPRSRGRRGGRQRHDGPPGSTVWSSPPEQRRAHSSGGGWRQPRWDRAMALAEVDTRRHGKRSGLPCRIRPPAACPRGRCRPVCSSRCMTASRSPRSFPK